jgi:hypothetical protein
VRTGGQAGRQADRQEGGVKFRCFFIFYSPYLIIITSTHQLGSCVQEIIVRPGFESARQEIDRGPGGWTTSSGRQTNKVSPRES